MFSETYFYVSALEATYKLCSDAEVKLHIHKLAISCYTTAMMSSTSTRNMVASIDIDEFLESLWNY